ncbi:glycosyl transferase family 1 [Bradyrhizobium japonicum]|uniref:glycosyl transferase family 1 n=1 Tax=Bradyrhizobium japonicum TaxID=375 RepID=UPI001BA84233|nr:glycosyl transferase family 1 [Bradyrhizobium japonicum]MBR0749936.1 glycosyl transferase family 1 [Bradyrhizobium japonicum]
MSSRIVYFVHDLSDAAVHRRVRMLRQGGATITVIGFRRSHAPVDIPQASEVVDLGLTHDAKLAKRSIAVARSLAQIDRLAHHVRESDLVIARNLEMLVLAARARHRYARSAKLCFECLDIHALLLSDRLPGRLLRTLESRLWRDVDLLVTSSPSFVEHYFRPRGFAGAIKLVENKVLVGSPPDAPDDNRPVRRPWQIGWFGMLRCRRSLEYLGRVSTALDGAVEVVIRGRPSSAIFPDFPATVAEHPFVRFEGPYGPDDLADIYGNVHFSWAIDYYEEGLNSSWLLPNRLYESGLHNVVPIALNGVATGRWLAERGIGILTEDPPVASLVEMLRQLDSGTYSRMRAGVAARPRNEFSVAPAECRQLVSELAGPRT